MTIQFGASPSHTPLKAKNAAQEKQVPQKQTFFERFITFKKEFWDPSHPTVDMGEVPANLLKPHDLKSKHSNSIINAIKSFWKKISNQQ